MEKEDGLELSVIMPCLNEAGTVGICVDWAKEFMTSNGINGEVIVVDNGSADASAEEAMAHGARVIEEKRRGYGRAIRTGIDESLGRIIIIGDADTTYDFLHLDKMYGLLADGSYDVVIGNRFAGGIEKGAMPWTHNFGVKFLSFCGRKRYNVNVYDFHCGLRGISGAAARHLDLRTDGMEFATEMIGRAAADKLRIGEVPVTLARCEYERSSKLNAIRDGIRHFKYIFMQAP